jgi:hypothetical protein
MQLALPICLPFYSGKYYHLTETVTYTLSLNQILVQKGILIEQHSEFASLKLKKNTK